jgi:hypothetical protein
MFCSCRNIPGTRSSLITPINLTRHQKKTNKERSKKRNRTKEKTCVHSQANEEEEEKINLMDYEGDNNRKRIHL